jgi:hypothetical protein
MRCIPYGDLHVCEKHAYKRRAYEMAAYERHAYEMVPVRGKPMG